MLKPLVQDTYHWRVESEIFSTLNEFWGFHQTTDHKNKFESGGEKLGFIENVSPTHKWCKRVENYTVPVSEHFFWIGFLLTQSLFTWKIPLAVFPPAMKLLCSAYIPLPELKNSGDHSDCFSFGQILSASCILLLLDSLTLIHQQTFFSGLPLLHSEGDLQRVWRKQGKERERWLETSERGSEELGTIVFENCVTLLNGPCLIFHLAALWLNCKLKMTWAH